MSTELEEKIAACLVNDQLPCSIAFKIAKELKVSLREVGETTDKLGIKLSSCQLGCFP